MKPELFFKALADETRLRIVHLIKDQELNVNEIVSILDMGQSRISRHLRILADSGLISLRKDGLWSFYSISEDPQIRRFIEEIGFIFAKLSGGEEDLVVREAILKKRASEIKQLFNSLAGDWTKIKEDIFGDFDLNRQIASLLDNAGSAADLGCGTGDLLKVLASGTDKVIGVDNSPKMLERARMFLADEEDKVDLRLGHIEHLPLRDKEVERVILNMVLHHFGNIPPVLGEAKRVLDDHGFIIVADFLKHNLEFMRTKYGDRRLGFSMDEFKDFFSEAGLTVVDENKVSLQKGLEIIIFKICK